MASTSALILAEAVPTDPRSVAIHRQAADALAKVIRCGQFTGVDEAPELAALFRLALEIARRRSKPGRFTLVHEGRRYRAVYGIRGRLTVCTWRGLPLTVGLRREA